jgi:hypothetical protein
MTNKKITDKADDTSAIDAALKIQQSLDESGDASELSAPERDAIHAEISSELESIASGADNDAIPDDAVKMPQSAAIKSKESDAKMMAKEIGTMIASGSEMLLGRNYGVDDTALDKWADSMAPLLVKYGLTDVGDLFEKYGEWIQAGTGCFMLTAGVFSAKRQYKIADIAAAKAEKAKLSEAA